MVTAALATSAAAVDVALLGGHAAYSMPQVSCSMGPFGANHKVVKMQSVYLADDLVAAGIVPGEAITAVGWQLQTRRRATGVVLNNIRVAHTWLDPAVVGSTATGIPMMTWASSVTTFLYSAGLTVDATVSISTALLPAAGNRHFVELSTPLVWDGSRHLLLEFSMENTVADILDRSCIGFKFAADGAGTANNRARTAFAYIYDDDCWATQSYPWSGLSAEGRSCTYSGRSMKANGYTGVVMDVALRTGRVATTSTASTSSSAALPSTLPATSSTASTSSSAASPSTLPATTTAPGGGGTSTAPGNSPGKNTDGDDDDDDATAGRNIAIEFAVLFAVCTVCLIVCVAMQRLALQDAREKLKKYEAGGTYSIGGGASTVLAVRNKTYSDVTVARVDDNAGLIENGGDGAGSSSA